MTHGNSFLSVVKSSTLTYPRKDDIVQDEGLSCPEEQDMEKQIWAGVSQGGMGAKSQNQEKPVTRDEKGWGWYLSLIV